MTTKTTDDDQNRRALLRQGRSRKTRDDIVRSAAHLWAKHGYDAISIADICEAAGVARTTYYFHFESKDELLGELTWLTARGVQAKLEQSLSEEGGLETRMAAFVDEVSRRVATAPKRLSAQVLMNAMPGVALLGHFPADRVDFGRMLTAVLRQAQTDGEVVADVDVAEIGAILGGMVMEGLLRWATGHTGKRTLDDVLRQRVDLVLDGIRVGDNPINGRSL
ncbi:MAG: TetR/AcrR family transcriptional regulator [Acidimicrobiia bacterium]